MSDTIKKARILIIGDAIPNTGFGKVIFEIFQPLKDKYDLVQLGTNYFGDPHDWPWRIYPAGIDAYQLGEHRIKPLVATLQPDLVFMLQDPWALVAYLKELRAFPKIPTVVYASFNAGNIEPALLPQLQSASSFVVYTQFARQALLDVLALYSDQAFPGIDVVPHGVDTAVFKPLKEDRKASQRKARQEVYPVENEALQNGFIVLNANRNQPRKRIDLTMEGFHVFAKDKPENVFLHLHMGLKDMGWDLKYLVKRYGLKERIVFSTDGGNAPHVSAATLNTIFNAADVGINTASSEGWGLVSFEQAAAGLPQIVPDHSSGCELWSGAAYLLPYEITLSNPYSKIDEYIIHPESVAAALEKAWSDPQDLQGHAGLCYENATRPEYRWSAISKQWEAVFENVLSKLS